MYFSLVPEINYDTKPYKYPYNESEFVTAKNFFRKYKIADDIFSYSVLMNKYAVIDGERPDQVAEKFYDKPQYDWIVLMTNNIVNRHFDWPRSDNSIRRYCETSFKDPYGEISHYETYEVKNGQQIKGDTTGRYLDVVVLEEGIKVDEAFYNKPFTYWDGTNPVTIPGSQACHPVSVYDHHINENEKKREIWILKSNYVHQFITEFKRNNLYQESSDYIRRRLKKTGV